jgi:hypothetical protein
MCWKFHHPRARTHPLFEMGQALWLVGEMPQGLWGPRLKNRQLRDIPNQRETARKLVAYLMAPDGAGRPFQYRPITQAQTVAKQVASELTNGR